MWYEREMGENNEKEKGLIKMKRIKAGLATG
jgi:hypothetical protein